MKSFLMGFVLYLTLLSRVDSTSYNGFKVYEVIPKTQNQASFLHKLSEDSKYDFWKESRILGKPSQVMVAPADQEVFEKIMLQEGFDYNVMVSNVESVLQREFMERSLTRSFIGLGNVTFSSFMFYYEQMAYLRRLEQDYPNLATVETIGHSHEGREILMLKISSGPSQSATPKPVILIDAGIHCREWIAPPVALYIIQQLVQNSENAALYQNVDWAIVPNLNPDGYEFTQTTNRLWRKNRRQAAGAQCVGTDLNRNFGHHWMVSGASSNPCQDTYAGSEAFSEPEAQAIRNWLQQNKDNVKLYLTFHSIGNMFLYPWSYAVEYPENGEELQLVGELAAEAIRAASTIGSTYIVGNSAEVLYASAGSSDDWVKAEGVNLSYTVELPQGDGQSFMLPARQILPVCQETWAGVKAFHKYVEETFIPVIPVIPLP